MPTSDEKTSKNPELLTLENELQLLSIIPLLKHISDSQNFELAITGKSLDYFSNLTTVQSLKSSLKTINSKAIISSSDSLLLQKIVLKARVFAR